MTDVRAVMLEYTEDDEPILRRLGGAVVAQWAHLPQEARDLLFRQAISMYDGEEQTGLKESIKLFIDKHQPTVAGK